MSDIRAWPVCLKSVCVALGVCVLPLDSADAFVSGRWVLPSGSSGIVTGTSGGLGPLAICRADHDHGQHTGKLWDGACHFEWGWGDVASRNYLVLLDDGYTWVDPFKMPPAGTMSGPRIEIPEKAVEGGDAGREGHNSRLIVCQAYVPEDRTWHPGKFYAGHCNIAWGGPGGNVSRERKRRAPTSDGKVLILVKR